MAHGDATRVLAELLPAGAVEDVHIYFPDPWWKKRHHKRRVMNEFLLKHVARVLAAEGRLHFWTDVGPYYEAALEVLAKIPELQGPEDVPETPATGDLDYRTHFERRTRLSGQPVYRSLFFRR